MVTGCKIIEMVLYVLNKGQIVDKSDDGQVLIKLIR